MIDMHYDLLSILYYCYLRNDFSYIEELKKNFNDTNVTGVIANFYFMSEEEMKREIGDVQIDVEKMFKLSVDLFKKYFPNLKATFSIEGCDFIKDTSSLERLKEMGLQSILLVWNNKNKYGSGPRSESGLTPLGKEFLIKAVDLGLIIDLSHMNKQTFYDTLDVLRGEKKKEKNVRVIVSHSDCYDLCDIPRNIDDDQIRALKEFDAVMGLVSYSFFLTKEMKNIEELKTEYLKHIKHVVNILGIDFVGVSTDDMSYDKYLFEKEISDVIFPYQSIKKDLENLLSREFSKEEINAILYKNIKKLLN